MLVYTIGHSTRTEQEFLRCLNNRGIKKIIDVRSSPTSKHVPIYNQWELKYWLNEAGINYVHIPELGGHRSKPKFVDSSTINGWRLKSFANYGGHMQTEEFQIGTQKLLKEAGEMLSAYMCSEGKWSSCHRRMVSDQMVVMDVEVQHITSVNKNKKHELTDFAVVKNGKITYPSKQLELTL